MRAFVWALTCALLLQASAVHELQAQASAPEQTARQALLEIVLAQTPGAVERHVPNAAHKAFFQDAGAPMPLVQQLESFRREITTSGGKLESFDNGPVLIKVADERPQHEAEVFVERDDPMGDGEEIELSLRVYQQGQPVPMPVVPRLIVLMKQENNIWKLTEITIALHVPLSDPDYLKGLQKMSSSRLESSAIIAVQTINTAEISYSASFPARGYTCKLAKLGSNSEQEAGPEHAMLIDQSLASGKSNGYVFSISSCGTAPASHYRIAAAPVDPDSEMRAFCSDESAVLRYAPDGKAATCLSEGIPLP